MVDRFTVEVGNREQVEPPGADALIYLFHLPVHATAKKTQEK